MLSHTFRKLAKPELGGAAAGWITEVIVVQTQQQTLDEVLELAATQFKVPRESLSADDDFFKKLGIDSLQALSLLTRL